MKKGDLGESLWINSTLKPPFWASIKERLERKSQEIMVAKAMEKIEWSFSAMIAKDTEDYWGNILHVGLNNAYIEWKNVGLQSHEHNKLR